MTRGQDMHSYVVDIEVARTPRRFTVRAASAGMAAHRARHAVVADGWMPDHIGAVRAENQDDASDVFESPTATVGTMTTEQRKTLDTMADYAERFAAMSIAKGDPNGAAWHASRASALRAALVERTCATCAHWTDMQHVSGPRIGVCSSDVHLSYNANELATTADDGCIKGWTPKEPTR